MTESSRGADSALQRALTLARATLESTPAGLLTDFDGTLSPVVSDPATARLVRGADGALQALANRLAVVAVITGRGSADARRLTGVPGLLVAGNHGTEWLEPGAAEPRTSPQAERIAERLDAVLAGLPDLAGVLTEHKGLSATVHYRNAPDARAAREAIMRAMDGAPHDGLELRDGRMSVELRPTGLGNKGSAARTIIERFGLRGVVVMGDDLTDLDMFRLVAELRAEGALGGAIIGVGGADHDAPAEVAAAADMMLAEPAEAAAFLAGLVSR